MNLNQRNTKKKLVKQKTLFTEINQEYIEEKQNLGKTFNLREYFSKEECTSLYFGHTKIDQKCYICLKCDRKGQNYLCKFCYENCHNNCRPLSKDKLEFLLEKEYLNYKLFSCYCGLKLKHLSEKGQNIIKSKCNMMKLDQNLGIGHYECTTHNKIICCICAVICHKQCIINYINEIDEELSCECNTDYHSNYNEIALNFPLEQYKKVTHIDIWPIQILNILFSTKSIFNKMSLFFHRTISNEIDFIKDVKNNEALFNKFENLLKLFSDTFNRKFKTYYYHQEIIEMFPFNDLFNIIKQLKAIDAKSSIIKFRMLFILLFIHLRKDFNTNKSLTSNDFYCYTFLERLKFKNVMKSNKIFSFEINEKYNLNIYSEVKKFVLMSICDLITKGMDFVSIEENQDEFEIGLKLISFMLKRMIFDKNDIILLINSLYNFHSNFYKYIISERNNIYSLIDIFNATIEICFIISVYYNDLIIEEYFENQNRNENDIHNINIIGNFIHSKSEHSLKLFTILVKNCDLFTKHFNLLIKPNLNKKDKEEIKKENIIRKHKIAMQNHILSRTTGVAIKMPENGGLFTEKIINLFIENLCLFSLADNNYQKNLNLITNDDINNYLRFCQNIQKDDFYEIMNIEQGKHHSNILYNLKQVINEIYYDLFVTSYNEQKNQLDQKLRSSLLNAIDQIHTNIKFFKNKEQFRNIIYKMEKVEKKVKRNSVKNNNNKVFDELETVKRKILTELTQTIKFAKSKFLLIQEGRELLIDNLIISQIDEILFKGLFFLSNIHYPNIITPELYDLFLKFLSLFLLTKNGTIYITTGKNLQIINKLINRLRYDEKNKNINEEKNHSLEFNLKCVKIVLHFLYNISEMIKLYDIRIMKGHKVLMKLKKSIMTHLKYFLYDLNSSNKEYEFKHQLKESLEIFSNLYPLYSYNQYEQIKFDIFDLFINKKFYLLKIDLFQNLFDKNILYNENQDFVKKRNIEVVYYFLFFKIISKNSYYVYKSEDYKKRAFILIEEFIDMDKFEKILNEASDIMSFKQKTILLKFIRTFIFIDHLDHFNYLKKDKPLTNSDYKNLIKNNIIKNFSINQYLKTSRNIKNVKKIKENERHKNMKKLDNINRLIILINIYSNEIEKFPRNIYNEDNFSIKNYIKELLFAINEISNYIYYNNDITNKIMPYYYKLFCKFITKKNLFIQILNDIQINTNLLDINKYEHLIHNFNRFNENDNNIINFLFNFFDKKVLFSLTLENIYEIYSKTKINSELSLQQYLDEYDNNTEANFPPFSLLEIKDYEYFYEEDNYSLDLMKKTSNIGEKMKLINEKYLEQFRNISMTSFLRILTGDSVDKRVDFGLKFTLLFESFINSIESGNRNAYRNLLCIMNKMLFYDCEHIQQLFSEVAYDKKFFNNLNSELNYYILQYISSSKKYELSKICSQITYVTKLIIQFFQLLGEGFNISFHENILEKIDEEKPLVIKKNSIFFENNGLFNDSNESEDDMNFIINDEIIKKSIRFSIKQEINIIKEKPLMNPKFSVYESMINNLKICFYLMKLNSKLEGELAFDKLCILSTNIIDFLIEYIDTKKSLINVIDTNMKNLFFGNNSAYHVKNKILRKVEQNSILSIFRMRLEEESNLNNINSKNKYKLRKTMLAFMKIKFFQLMKLYIQLGTKEDFVKLLLKNKIGPIELFEEVIYYMSELINNLVSKNYDKYSYLLETISISSYKDKLQKLYMEEDDFRTSIELNLVFQIVIIIKILEDIYDVSILKEYYDNGYINDNNINLENDDINEIKIEEEKNLEIEFGDISNKENLEIIPESENENDKNIDIKNKELDNNNLKINEEIIYQKIKEAKELGRNKINDLNYNITNNITNTLAPLKTKNFSTFNNTADNDINDEKNNNNIITLKQNPKYNIYKTEEEKNVFTYQKVLDNYKKLIKTKKKQEINFKLNTKKSKLSPDELNLRSIFSISVYKFLFSLISKVEIKLDNSENAILLKRSYKNTCISNLSKKISNKIIDFKQKDKFLLRTSVQENLERIKPLKEDKNTKNKYLNFQDKENKVFFFIKPYLCFHLTEDTRKNFLLNVDRSSAKTKYRDLIMFADYAIFEMVYNKKYVSKYNFLKKISNIKFQHLHIFNYILILIENAALSFQYYKSHTLDSNEYEAINNVKVMRKYLDLILIVVIKTIINIIFFILWFYCNFVLELQKNVIFSKEKTFIFRQKGEKVQNINHPTIVKYFQSDEGGIIETLKLVNKDIDIFSLLKIIIFDSILFNIDINILVFSIVLNFLYLAYSHPLFLSFETLFIFSIFPSLINIFKAFTNKFTSLLYCLIFTYLIVYIYNWLTIFNIRESFISEETLDYQSGQYKTEPFCHSSFQCLLILINYGTRAGGGIGDLLPIPSYKYSTKMFVGRFIYDMTFYFFVIMIMGNITFGTIIDSFGELRDDTDKFENDKNNICFICQLNRDKCLIKNIDFDSHIKNEHNLWNYIDFLIYLHLNNPNDFSRIEGIVWDNLIEKDFGWMPIDPNAGEEDDD